MIQRRAHVLAPLTAAALIAQQVGSNALRDGLFLSSFPVSSLPYFMAGAAVLAVPAAHASGRLLTRFGPIRVVPAVLGIERAPVLRRVGAARLAAARRVDAPLSPFERARGDRHLGVLVAPQRAIRRAFGQAADDPGGGGRDVRRPGRGPWSRARRRAAAARCAAPGPRRGCRRLRRRSLGAWPGCATQAGARRRAGRNRRLDTTSGVSRCCGIWHSSSPWRRWWRLWWTTCSRPRPSATSEKASRSCVSSGSSTPAQALAAVLIQSTIGRTVLGRLGLGGSVASHPVIVGTAALCGFVVPFPWWGVLPRGLDISIRNSIFRAGYELLYTPLAEATKRSAKSIVDVACDCAGKGAGAGLIVVLAMLVPKHPFTAVNVAVVVAAGAEFLVARRLRTGTWGRSRADCAARSRSSIRHRSIPWPTSRSRGAWAGSIGRRSNGRLEWSRASQPGPLRVDDARAGRSRGGRDRRAPVAGHRPNSIRPP